MPNSSKQAALTGTTQTQQRGRPTEQGAQQHSSRADGAAPAHERHPARWPTGSEQRPAGGSRADATAGDERQRPGSDGSSQPAEQQPSRAAQQSRQQSGSQAAATGGGGTAKPTSPAATTEPSQQREPHSLPARGRSGAVDRGGAASQRPPASTERPTEHKQRGQASAEHTAGAQTAQQQTPHEQSPSAQSRETESSRHGRQPAARARRSPADRQRREAAASHSRQAAERTKHIPTARPQQAAAARHHRQPGRRQDGQTPAPPARQPVPFPAFPSRPQARPVKDINPRHCPAGGQGHGRVAHSKQRLVFRSSCDCGLPLSLARGQERRRVPSGTQATGLKSSHRSLQGRRRGQRLFRL